MARCLGDTGPNRKRSTGHRLPPMRRVLHESFVMGRTTDKGCLSSIWSVVDRVLNSDYCGYFSVDSP